MLLFMAVKTHAQQPMAAVKNWGSTKIIKGFEQLDNAIVVKQISQTAFAIVAAIENKANYEGLVLIQATYQNQVIASAKSLIIKNQ
jgi:hypothetical protein